MLRNEFEERQGQLCALADQLKQKGHSALLERVNFEIQELDFKLMPELARPHPWEQVP